MSKTTTKKTIGLGNRFLEDARDTHRRVSVYLVNGFQLKGEVVTFDEETILFQRTRKGKSRGQDGHQQDGQLLVKRSAVAVMHPLSKSEGEAEEWWRNFPARSSSESFAKAAFDEFEIAH